MATAIQSPGVYASSSITATTATASAPSSARALAGQAADEALGTQRSAETVEISHDCQVESKVNGFIDSVNNNPTYKGLSVADKLHLVRAQVIGARETGDTKDTVLRDTEYYFAGRESVADSDSKAEKVAKGAAGLGALGLYNTLKTVTPKGMMETDKGKPTSTPGGFSWELNGIKDGFKDNGASLSKIPQHAPSCPAEAAPAPAPAPKEIGNS